MLSCWHTLLWACNAPLEYEPIRLEASPRHGRGLAVCPLQRFVRRLAGPLRPHLLGFITWTYRPYRPESSLLRWACIHTLWEQSCQRFLDRNALRLPFWRDLAGIVAIGSCSSAADPLVRFLPLHEPIVVQFHCVIEIDFSSGEKRLFPICVFIKTQYSFRISGNRGYDSNRVRFCIFGSTLPTLFFLIKCLK